MSFTQGQLITASELNTVNMAQYLRYYVDSNVGWSYWPSSAGIYVRNKTKQFYFSWYNGLFGGGDYYLQKKIDGVWTDLWHQHFGWNTNTSGSYTTGGEGWYRVYFQGAARKEFILYWAHHPNIVGSFLRYYDDYNGSGYTPEQLLTATALNSGRVGTIA